jgi:hypothetical protein
MSIEGIFPVIVDYSISLAQLVEAGAYDYVDGEITDEHFPVRGRGIFELDIELVHYRKDMESDDVIRDQNRRGLLTATLPELLAFGTTYPTKQLEFPIVALGSVWKYRFDYHYVAQLCGFRSERKLALSLWRVGWGSSCRFAAIRK